jgi:hypothetical protein
MGTSTPSLQLWKPDPDADNVNVETDLNDNYDKLDAAHIATQAAITTILKARKTVDETVTSSITLQADDDLFLPVAANSIYLLDCFIPFSGAAIGLGGIRSDWTGPAGFNLDWAAYGTNGMAGGSETDYDVVIQVAAGLRSQPTNAGTTMSMRPTGTLVTVGTAGTLAFRWAQASSNATGTTVKKNAWIRLMKI